MSNVISSASITTNCTCQAVDEDGNYLEDEQGNPVPVEGYDCDGDCWYAQRDDIDSFIEDWLCDNDADKETYVRITCDSHRWNHTGFRALVKAEDILNALSLNADFRLEFRIDNFGVLSATRYSHDENVGTAPFVVTIASEEDLQDLEF